jgi:hypothetical protein
MQFLLTGPGRLIFYDEGSGRLMHGPIDTSPRTLMAADGAVFRSMSAEAADTPWDRLVDVSLRPEGEDGALLLAANWLRLDAIDDLALEGQSGAQAPGFALPVFAVPPDTLTCLSRLAGSAWITLSTAQIIEPGAIVHTGDGCLRVGDMTCRYGDIADLAISGEAWLPPVAAFQLVYEGWKIEYLRPWRPLVYFCAFGTGEMFQLLHLALDSLFTHGGYSGDVLVLGNEDSRASLGILPGWILARIRFHSVPGTDFLDFTLARYRLCDIINPACFGPVLYLDTDVICDNTILPLLRDVAVSSKPLALAEGDLLADAGYWGAPFFRQDARSAGARLTGSFSTGVLGAASALMLRAAFRTIIETTEGFCRAHGTRTLPAYDQPGANYVLNKSAGIEIGSLRKYLRNHLGKLESVPALDDRRGLVHFPGGVGYAAPKLACMQRYLAALAGPAPGGDAPLYAGTMERQHINAYVQQRTGGRVQAGPFRGMRVLAEGFWSDGDITPKLLGVYEQELHSAIATLADGEIGAIVNIGAGEGYYAIGLALRCPGVPVHAFEADPREHAVIRHNAEANGVADRVYVHGTCVPEDVAALADTHGRLLVICDCEGFETALFATPGVAAALRHSDLVIECHDFADPGCTPAVFASLWRTHMIEVIYAGGRDPGAFPMLARFSDRDRWAAVCENRPRLMNWLVCKAR